MSSAADRVVLLRQLAHARAGDKGDRLNVGVFAYHDELFPCWSSS